MDHQDQIGIVTGNWGCGAFGGDPELKATIQWLAASQVIFCPASFISTQLLTVVITSVIVDVCAYSECFSTYYVSR